MKRLKNEKVLVLRFWRILTFSVLTIFVSKDAKATRLKDIARIEGMRSNYLVGFGIVVGLRGTGDTLSPNLTVQTIVNLLQRMGIRPDPSALRSFGIIVPRTWRPRDTAICMVTAELPPFAKPGMRIDVTVAAVGDARSLRGGQLVLTPLFGPDGKIWAFAQGQVITGGKQVAHSTFLLEGGFATAGVIPSGAIVEREIEVDLNSKRSFRVILDTADFSTAQYVADKINQLAQVSIAYVQDPRTIFVVVPEEYYGRVADLIAVIENIEVVPDAPAKVVVNERTGTVVMGENVAISEVAVSHGELVVVVEKEPSPLPPEFQTATSQFEKRKVHLLRRGVTVRDLVNALNRIGATPQDIIAILQAIKRAGALHAQLEVQ